MHMLTHFLQLLDYLTNASEATGYAARVCSFFDAVRLTQNRA